MTELASTGKEEYKYARALMQMRSLSAHCVEREPLRRTAGRREKMCVLVVAMEERERSPWMQP